MHIGGWCGAVSAVRNPIETQLVAVEFVSQVPKPDGRARETFLNVRKQVGRLRNRRVWASVCQAFRVGIVGRGLPITSSDMSGGESTQRLLLTLRAF